MSSSFGHLLLLQLKLFANLSPDVYCNEGDNRTCEVEGVKDLPSKNTSALFFRTNDSADYPLRPEGTPDIYIFSFSGHKPRPGDNTEYLCFDGDFSSFLDGGVTQMGNHLEASLNNLSNDSKWMVEKSCYADELYDTYDRRDSKGFLSAIEEWNHVYKTYVHGYRNPTRIVVIGHSHGTVWARNLLMMAWLSNDVATMPVDYLIDLDGVALGWEEPFGGVGDHWQTEVKAAFQDGTYRYNTSFPSGQWWDDWRPWLTFERYEISDAEGSIPLSIKDIVPPNVAHNIEVIAEIPVGVSDLQLNYRYDGSRSDIESKVYYVHNHIDIRQWGRKPLYDIHDTLLDFGKELKQDYPQDWYGYLTP